MSKDRRSLTAGPPIKWRLLLSALALFWERLWPRLWPVVFIGLAFLALALLDVLPRLPATAHALILVLFVASLAYALIQVLPALRPLEPAAVQRRLDRTAATADRPLAALADRLADPAATPLTQAIWQRHRDRMAAAATTLAVRWPAPGMARREPWGIRAGILLVCVIAVVAAGSDWPARLERAVRPQLVTAAAPASIEVWITPQAYTGKPPMFLRGTAAEVGAPSAPGVPVPAGSTVLARVTGASGALTLQAGAATASFVAMPGEAGAATAYRAEAVVTAGPRLSVHAGRRELAGWPLTVVADRPPRVDIDGTPGEKGNGLFEIGFTADDDYGLAGLEMVIRRDTAGAPEPPASSLRLPLTLAEPGALAAAGRNVLDLAAHPWAGHSVHVRLEARDGLHQLGSSREVTATLPERLFSHPVAFTIAGERKRLFVNDGDQREAVAAALARIGEAPEAFGNDLVVGLGLAVSHWRLRTEGEPGVASVRDLLWNLAVRLEDGNMPAAEQRVAEARQRLQEALRSGASSAEIERLMDALKEALDNYLATLAMEIARRQGGEMPMLAPGEQLHADDLRDLVDRARELSRAGAREGARALLGELERLLDGIRMGLRQTPDSEQLRAAQQLLNQLRQLQENQQKLLDQTFGQLREQQDQRRTGRRSSSDHDAAMAAQQGLRRELGDLADRLQDRLGRLPAPLDVADQAMREALQALTGDRLGEAVGAQSRAVDALAQALAASRDAFAAQMGSGAGQFGFGPGGTDGDPFGRPAAQGSRGFALGTVGIPERSEIEQIQQLLRELRRRAGERDRPSQELDYLRRLLQPF